MNSSDFPKIPLQVGKDALKLTVEDFVNALSKVLFCVSVDETRPVLTGALFEFKRGEVTIVATDGFRLSKKKLSLGAQGKAQKMISPEEVNL